MASGGETDVWLIIERGAHSKSFPITVVSNKPIDEDDFKYWRKQCNADHCQATLVKEAAEVAERMKAAEK